MTSKAEREAKRLADFNQPGLGSEGSRRTGASRGGVKEGTTKVGGLAAKLDLQAKEAAEKRQLELKQSRQLYTPKSGSKSLRGSPRSLLTELGCKGSQQELQEQAAELSSSQLESKWS